MMIRKGTLGLLLCISGTILSIFFGKPIHDPNFLFAFICIVMICFGGGLMQGENKW
jgi:hypothetical protein